MNADIKAILSDFATKLVDAVRAEVREETIAKLGGSGKVLQLPGKKARRKGPIQLCPVPGCKERAAPVFGMVCAKHKGLPKTQIKKYREARRAKAAKKAA